MSGISRDRFEAIKARGPQQWPELELDTPRGVFEVDRSYRDQNLPPTSLGQSVEEAFASARPTPRAQPNLFQQALEGLRSYDERIGPKGTLGTLVPQYHLARTAMTPILGEMSGPGGAVLSEASRPINYLPVGAGVGLARSALMGVGSALIGRSAQSEVEQATGSRTAGMIAGLAGSLVGAGAVGKLTSSGRLALEEVGGGSADDVLKAAQGVMRGLIGKGFTRNQVRNAEIELRKALDSIETAGRTGIENTPRIGIATRAILERAGLTDFASRFGDVGDVVRGTRAAKGATGIAGRTRAGVVRDVVGPADPARSVAAATTRLGPFERAGWGSGRGAEPLAGPAGGTRAARAAQQTEGTAGAITAQARHTELAEELTKPDGWWRARRGAEPIPPAVGGIRPRANTPGATMEGTAGAITAQARQAGMAENLTPTGGLWRSRKGAEPVNLNAVQRATISAARARRDQLNTALKKVGVTPELTGTGKVAQLVGGVLRAGQRTLLGGELSAVTRQGGRLAPGHPLDTAKAWGSALRALKSDDAWRSFDDGLKATFEGRLFESAGGKLRSLDDPAGMRDIAISEFPDKIPFLGQWYKLTERGSFAGLNAQALNVFKTLVKNNWDSIAPGLDYDTYARSGIIPTSGIDKPTLEQFANLITVAQGRSPWLARNFGEYLPALNAGFLAPHWRASRLEQASLDVKALANITSDAVLRRRVDPVSKEIAKNAVAYYGSGMAFLGLLYQAGIGDKVGIDPRASNFGKIDIGPVSFDIWGGQAQLARMIAQMASGTAVSRAGNERDVNRLKPLVDWMRSGLGVGPGLAVDYATDSTMAGQKFDWNDALTQRLTNIYAQDIQQALDAELGIEFTPKGVVKGLAQTVVPGFLGVGMNRLMSATEQKLNELAGGDFNEADAQTKQRILSENPNLATSLDEERAKASGITGAVESVRQDYAQSQKILDSELESGIKEPDEWYAETGEIEREAGVLIARKYRESGSKPTDFAAQPEDTPKDWYGRIIAANTNPDDPTGRRVDWDAVEKWRASLTDEQDRFIDDHTSTRPLTGPAGQRAQFKRELRQSGYWEIKDQAWEGFKHPVARQYKTYQEFERAVRERAMAQFGENVPETVKLKAADALVEQDPLIDAYRKRANTIEMPWIVKNPALADKAYTYGVFTPTKPQAAMIAFKLGRKSAGD